MNDPPQSTASANSAVTPLKPSPMYTSGIHTMPDVMARSLVTQLVQQKGVAEKEVLDDFETWRKARRETRRRR